MKLLLLFLTLYCGSLFSQDKVLQSLNFIKIDSSNSYQKDKNTEIVYYSIHSKYDDLSIWKKAEERGIIQNVMLNGKKKILKEEIKN